MLIGYARVSKADGSQLLDLQRDALLDADVAAERSSALQIASSAPFAARGSLLYPRCPDCGAELRRLVDAPRAVRACRGCGTRFLDSRFLTTDRARVRSPAA